MEFGIEWKKVKRKLNYRKLDEVALEGIDQGNIQSGYTVAKLVGVIEVSMMVSSLLLGQKWESTATLREYQIAYLFLLLASLFFAFFCKAYHKVDQKNHRKVQRSVMLYVLCCTFFGVYVAAKDYSRGFSLLSFITIEIVIFGFFLFSPTVSFLLITISFAGFYGIINAISSVTLGDSVNLLFLWIGITVMNMVRYSIHLRVLDAQSEMVDLNNQLQQANEKLLLSSSMDVLTGMKNRYALRQDHNRFIGMDITLMMIDLDDIKFYNDTYGHDVGDVILIEFGKITKKYFGKETCYRYGGDEYLIIVKNIADEVFTETLNVWREEFFQCVNFQYGFHPTCSGGYIFGKVEAEADFLAMIRMADMKMYEAKGRGKNLIIGAEYDGNSVLDDKTVIDSKIQTEGVDTLTGLFNMMYFRNKARILLDTIRADTRIEFVYFNISNFKKYNEKYGFHEGDVFLRVIADILRETFPQRLICHLSDDHFAVMTYADSLEEKLCRIHERVLAYSLRPVMVIRAGICGYENGSDDVGTIIDKARIACDNTNDRYDVFYRYYDDELEKKKNRQQYIIDHIDEAIENEYIQAYYQPIVRTITGEMCGAEALARWNDPQYGLLRPNDFIDVLEDFHLIYKLDFYMVEMVGRDYAERKRRGESMLPVSVNLSRLDFRLFDVVEALKGILQKYDMPEKMLHIEITESALTEDYEELIGKIGQLRSAGFEVWLDDFGSGYSSLNILQDYCFDVIKIDMLFLKKFDQNQNSHLIIASVVDMAKELGITTLTEGIETVQQLDFLRKIGCERVQGYYFSRPVPATSFGKGADGYYMKAEDESHYVYYNAIGRVNLLKPVLNEMAYLTHRQIGVIPMAVIQYNGSACSYLMMNEEYTKFAGRTGQLGKDGNENLLIALESLNGMKFSEAVDACIDNGEWRNFEYLNGNNCCSMHMRYIASEENTGVVAILLMAMNLSRMQDDRNTAW
ncbi:MAG: bifunctional diguanylate cyclase/phosphodiesterase [Butyrivibrio sp.]|nr:bifunctional diguanylate cyclase/phosphodiesterase [Butyrivibrio sp.]